MSIVKVTPASATGAEIAQLIDELDEVLDGKPLPHVIMAALSITFIAQYPQISPDDLVEGIQGVSEWIVSYIERKAESDKSLSEEDQLKLELLNLTPTSKLPN